jgi:hypothetical protein
MATDYNRLTTTDPALATKFVMLNATIGAVCLMDTMLLLILWYHLIKEASPAPVGTNQTANRVASAMGAVFCGTMAIVLPAPFTEHGDISGLPKSELSFFYTAAFWAGLMFAGTITSVRELKWAFEKWGNKHG